MGTLCYAFRRDGRDSGGTLPGGLVRVAPDLWLRAAVGVTGGISARPGPGLFRQMNLCCACGRGDVGRGRICEVIDKADRLFTWPPTCLNLARPCSPIGARPGGSSLSACGRA